MSNASFSNMFKCPECGGFRWGTDLSNPDKYVGHCHGFKEDGSRCHFSWDRNTKDEEVFIGDKRV